MADTSETLATLRASIARIESGQGSGSFAPDTSGASSFRSKRVTSDVDQEGALSDVEDFDGVANAKSRAVKDNSQASPDEAFARIVELVSHAPRTTGDVRRRLKSERYPDTSIAPAVERARDCLLLDDGHFAEQYALSRLGRGFGMERIKRELREKGIDVQSYPFWDELEDEYGAETEMERALAYAEAHMPTSKHPGKSLYAALIRRGFTSRCASETVRKVGLNLYG